MKRILFQLKKKGGGELVGGRKHRGGAGRWSEFNTAFQAESWTQQRC